jgi:enediyne biosynthesis protein E4
MSINVADFDGDGIEDLFLSQNFFSAIPENASAEALSRNDSGRGLWLRGNGNGTFKGVDGSETGIKIYGEQRGAAVADFDHDGRVDLCVSQNNGATKLYMNEGGKRALRVTVRSSAGNPDAVGAQIRLEFGDGRRGPTRSVTAGFGNASTGFRRSTRCGLDSLAGRSRRAGPDGQTSVGCHCPLALAALFRIFQSRLNC